MKRQLDRISFAIIIVMLKSYTNNSIVTVVSDDADDGDECTSISAGKSKQSYSYTD